MWELGCGAHVSACAAGDRAGRGTAVSLCAVAVEVALVTGGNVQGWAMYM